MSRLAPVRRLIANRPLAALVAAAAISGVGDWIYLTVLPVLVYERTADPTLVGVAVIGRLIPFFLLSMPAGLVADRFPRRRVLITSESARALAMILIAILCVVGGDIRILVGLTIAAAAAGTFSFPAQASMTPALAVDDIELGYANATLATLDSVACVIGPGLSGLLILAGGLPLAFLLNGLSFAAVALALVVFRPRDDGRSGEPTYGEPGPTTAIAWPSFLRRLASPLLLDGAISLASAGLSVLIVVVAVDLLHGGHALTGALNAAGGVGGILGGITAGLVVNGRPRVGIAAAVLAFSIAMLVLGVTTAAALAAVAIGVAIGSITTLDATNTTSLQRLTADGTTGRAFGILHSLAALWMMAGVVLTTVLIAMAGIGPAVIGLGLVVLVLGGISVLTQARLAAPMREAPKLMDPSAASA